MTKRNLTMAGTMAAAILLFYGMLVREAVNMPFLDDYGGVLGFISDWSRIDSVAGKAISIFTSQHNEYKLMFANAVYALQYLISGRVDFIVLSIFGNLLLLPLFFVIYRMWMDDTRVVQEKLLLFLPVPWLLFQLQYYSLLNWPMSSLQHIAVVVFSLLSIYLLSKNESKTFYISVVSLLLAISASGNGFFVIPIGCLMLLQFRRWGRLLLWLGGSASMLAVYLYKYDYHQSQAHADHSIVSSLFHLSPFYAFSFLGASIARYQSWGPAAVLGASLCLVFVYSAVDKLYARSPAIFYSMCFILVTSLAVSGLRSDFGITQSLVSRYRIYSNLLLIFIYLYAIGKVSGRLRSRHVQLTLAAIIAIATIGFNAASNYAGFKLLKNRTDLTTEGMRRWEHGEHSTRVDSGPMSEDPVIQRQRENGNYEPQDQYLREAIYLHLYKPPVL